MQNDGFTGIKDLDKELLLKMDDREFIMTCGLNSYFKNICHSNNNLLFKKGWKSFIRIR